MHPIFRDRVRGVYAYDSILFIARGPVTKKLAVLKRPPVSQKAQEGQPDSGTWISYGEGHPIKQLRDSGHCKHKTAGKLSEEGKDGNE